MVTLDWPWAVLLLLAVIIVFLIVDHWPRA
jgi:hypothetical protein